MDNNLISRNLEKTQVANFRQKWLFGSRLSGKMAYIYELAVMRDSAVRLGSERNRALRTAITKHEKKNK